MIKEIKTEKFEGLAILMPNRYVSAFANMGYLVVKADNPATDIGEDEMFPPDKLIKALARVSKLPEHITLPAIKLPDGEFQILGKAKDLTEAQCSSIINEERLPFANYDVIGYQNYNDTSCVLDTAKTSFNSLMQSIGAYSVNPVDKDDNVINMYPEWQEAQANTGTWIILKKL